MTTATTPPSASRVSVSALAAVKLNAQHERVMGFAAATCRGPVEWQNRKLAETHDLLALSQISYRLRVEWIDLFDAMRVSLIMKVPVPCLPNPNQPVQIETHARLGLTYRREAIFTPQPGYSFINILWPPFVWIASVAFDPRQPLCLGQLPKNIPVKELILLAYGALSLQSVQIDIFDSLGTLNPSGAEYWQRNIENIPLTHEPFIAAAEETK